MPISQGLVLIWVEGGGGGPREKDSLKNVQYACKCKYGPFSINMHVTV